MLLKDYNVNDQNQRSHFSPLFFLEYIILIVSMYIVICHFFSHSSASRIKEKTQILNEIVFFHSCALSRPLR